MRFLRSNTAIRLTVGPFLDKTDGITPETALTATSEKITLMVDDGNVPTLVIDAMATASGGNNDFVHVTNDDCGFYDLELTAAQLNYVGRAMLCIADTATHCPVFHEFMILPANVYDSFVLGTSILQVNTTQVAGTVQTARDLGAQLDTTVSSRLATAGYTAPDNTTITTINSKLGAFAGSGLNTVLGFLRAIMRKDAALTPSDVGGTYDNTTDSHEAVKDNQLDAAISSRSSHSAADVWAVGSRTLTSFGTLAADVWNNATRTLSAFAFSVTVGTNNDKTGYALSVAGVQAIWDALTSALTTVNSIGKRIVDNLDVAVSSRSTYAGADTAGTTTLLGRLTAGRATNLDNLDVAVTTRATPAQVNTEVDTALVDIHLDHLLAVDYDPANKPGVATALLNELVESDAGVSRYTANALEQAPSGGGLDAAGVRAAIGLASANLDTQLDALPTAAENADAVWDEAIAGHLGAGSTGNALNAAGSAGDPWSTPIPGAYGAGTAGNIIGNRLDAAITTRSSHSVADIWNNATRTLTSYGSLIADMWAAVVDSTGVTTLLSRLTAGRATNLDNLDVATSTRATPAQVNTEIDTALTDIHLDHLLATDYDPSNKPGVATALLNELVESDLGVSRFTANALEQAPAGGGGGGGATAQQIWEYATRTLTQSAAQVQSIVRGTDLILHRDATMQFTLTGLANLTNYEKIWFTIKKNARNVDTASELQIVLSNPVAGSDGLQYIHGGLPSGLVTAADGIITNVTATTITILISAEAMAVIGEGVYGYDVKAKFSGSTITLASSGGNVTVLETVTDAIV